MVSKKVIANAICKFIENDLIQGIEDMQVKFALSLANKSLIDNPDIIDKFINNSFISSIIYEENGMYEIKDFSIILKKVLDECGTYPITIPKIPLILPHEKTIQIEPSDIDKIMTYMGMSLSISQ